MIARWLTVLALATPATAATLADDADYAMIVDVASRSKVPFAGTTDVVSRTLLHLRLTRDAGGVLQATQQVCDVKLLSDSRAETVLPEAFIRALPRQTFPVQLSVVDGETRFSADPGPTHVGYDPAVTGGAVPDKADASGVVDTDGDGYPGVTVNLVIPVFGSVRIYVAQHGHSRYQGIVSDGGAAGRVEIVALDQQTLGASFAPFAANPEITPIPASSRFRMLPAELGVSCTELRARWTGGYELP